MGQGPPIQRAKGGQGQAQRGSPVVHPQALRLASWGVWAGVEEALREQAQAQQRAKGTPGAHRPGSPGGGEKEEGAEGAAERTLEQLKERLRRTMSALRAAPVGRNRDLDRGPGCGTWWGGGGGG